MTGLRLQPLGEQHLEGLAALLEDPDVLRFTRVPLPPPEGFAEQWIARYEAGRREGTREAFAGVSDAGEFLGMALAPEIDPVAGQAELGYVVAPGARGRGVATELLRQMTQWAFAVRGLHRVHLLIDVANAASQQVARHCGYLHEGTLRSAWFKPGAPRTDITIWARLATD